MISPNRWKQTSALVSLFYLVIASGYAAGLPSHGHFVGGHGWIDKGNQSLTVKQSSTTGIIDWNRFSVSKHDGVTFDNGSGATFNRVTGGNLSTIAGSLHATGSLYLMNKAGVIISGTGHVVTGGNFVATSGNISDSAFDEGHRKFLGTKMAVINRGRIVAGDNAKLVGHLVTDSGTIHGANVKLNGLHELTVTGEVIAVHANGQGGDITALGHTIVIGTHGEIDASASSPDHAGGKIDILATRSATIAGALTAEGGRKRVGGFIETSGRHLQIGGRVDAGRHGIWLVDPRNLTVDVSAASTIGAALDKGSNVTLQTTGTGVSGPGTSSKGAGDIILEAGLSWKTNAKLTLDAYHSIFVENPILAKDGGSLYVTTNDGGSGGDYSFGQQGYVDFGGKDKGSALHINGVEFTLVYTMAAFKNINSKLAGNYALATSLDATSTKDWIPLGTNGEGLLIGKDQDGFSGMFEGLGNTISNLTIDIGSNDLAGLFGYSMGTIRDLGVIGGSVTGGSNVGGLLGANYGHVLNSFSSASVTASKGRVGGLVGENDSYILNSYATGNVTDPSNGTGGAAGGLVGLNYYIIEDSFASGAVVSNDDDAGGLVGFNDATISDSYASGPVSETNGNAGGLVGRNTISAGIFESFALGAVSGSGNIGGLVGENVNGTIGKSYWDVETSGLSNGIGDNNDPDNTPVSTKGWTTAELQSALPKALKDGNWSIVAGKSFPYLTWQAPFGKPQVVSGVISGASNVGISVGITVDGNSATLTSMTSGANGYYYELLAPQTISSIGSDVLVYEQGVTAPGNTFEDNAESSLLNFDITPDAFIANSSVSTAAELLAGITAAIGTNTSDDFLYSSDGVFAKGTTLDLGLSAASFDVNSSIAVESGAVDFSAAGSVSESTHGAIRAEALMGSTHGAVALTSKRNAVTNLGQFTTGGDNDFSLTDDHALTVAGTVNAGSASLSLTTVDKKHGLTIDGAIKGGSVNLTTAGEATETTQAAIVANKVLNVVADTGIDLTSKHNKIKKLGTDETKTGPNKVTL